VPSPKGSLLNAGRSISEMLWEQLDAVMETLMSEGDPYSRKEWDPDDIDAIRNQVQEYGELRGKAQGFAHAIALMYSPYDPHIDHIKELAMERWESRNG
jgi:hypothetical protein